MSIKEDVQAKKERVILSAKELFITQGFENTSIRQIVKESNITMGNLYFHFKNKEEILEIVFNDIQRNILNIGIEALEGTKDIYVKYIFFHILFLNALTLNKKLENIVKAVLDSQSIYKTLRAKRIERLRRVLEAENIEYSEEYMKAIIIGMHGCFDRMLIRVIEGELELDLKDLNEIFARYSLSQFNLTRDSIKIIVDKIHEIFYEKNVNDKLKNMEI